MEQIIDQLFKIRHSSAHLLAYAVKNLYPHVKVAIGPVIDTGFYYDFDLLDIKDTDLPKIEAEMQKLIKLGFKFEQSFMSAMDAKKLFKDEPYKLELISEIEKGERDDFGKKGEVSIFKSGEFIDLCKGPHVSNISEVKAFKLLSIAGAYWKGSEKNKMLTRIYGTAFENQKELDEYLLMVEEAKKRDHRKIGKELELLMFHETAPGMAYWLPKGVTLYNELIKYWREEHQIHNYQEIMSPLINKKELWEISGHWDHYKEDMFICDMGENEVYGVKPMNCPNAMLVFASKTRSYKDLPFRLSDTDRLHRYERSGTLNGLLRIRSFQQDDSHNYISEEMIGSEYEHVFALCEKFYGIFGLEYSFRMGTRPEGFLGEIETWNKAEKILKDVLEKQKRKYFILEGDGAFYGPKIDILMKDAIGREWQMGTIQLDFQQPKRFNLKYSDNEGKEITPVCIHRVIYGSLERFIGILIEHFAGSFPIWLSPVQVSVLSVSESSLEYSNKIKGQLIENGIRADLMDDNESIGNKIRKAQEQKTPYMLIIGEKESVSNTISIRMRDGKQINNIPLAEFMDKVKSLINLKSLALWQ